MSESEDKPIFTFEGICDLIKNLLLVLGLVAACAIVGLWFGGFFHWVAKSFPQGMLAALIGV